MLVQPEFSGGGRFFAKRTERGGTGADGKAGAQAKGEREKAVCPAAGP